MGCFLGCFGLSSKRKRRRHADRVLSGGQVRRLCHYEVLKSVPADLDIPGEEELRKTKETLNSKIRKKVRFNLNVQTYEPIPREEIVDLSWGNNEDEDEDDDRVREAGSGECELFSVSDGEPAAAKAALYPPNHRYRNCIDGYDEEDEIAYYESDLDDDNDDYDEDEVDPDDLRESREEFIEQVNSLPVNLQIGVHSVLKPVENITQWKAAKAKGITTPVIKQQSKENIPVSEESEKPVGLMPAPGPTKHATQEVAVNASLSTWLVFSDPNEPFSASYANGRRFDRKSSLMNSADNPILDP